VTELDAKLLGRAVELATQGRGYVEPNPMVGCVIARDGRIIGEGFHAKFGQPHAEPSAIASLVESPRGATAYVTLEPCCHTDKQTPPCVPRLIEAGIARVVIGALDPNPQVNGKGIEQLRAAGILVERVVDDDCLGLIEAFTINTLKQRPMVTVKYAVSADGKLAGTRGERLQISSPESAVRVHTFRGWVDAILVGGSTVKNDNPRLTARGVEVRRVARRIVLDPSRDAPGNAVVFDEPPMTSVYRSRDLHGVMASLWQDYRVAHVLVEAGPRLIRAFVEAGLADRVWAIRSPRRVDAVDAPVEPEAVRSLREVAPEVARSRVGPDEWVELRQDATSGVSTDFNLLHGLKRSTTQA